MGIVIVIVIVIVISIIISVVISAFSPTLTLSIDRPYAAIVLDSLAMLLRRALSSAIMTTSGTLSADSAAVAIALILQKRSSKKKKPKPKPKSKPRSKDDSGSQVSSATTRGERSATRNKQSIKNTQSMTMLIRVMIVMPRRERWHPKAETKETGRRMLGNICGIGHGIHTKAGTSISPDDGGLIRL